MDRRNMDTGASRSIARRAFIAGIIGIAGTTVLACAGGAPAQPTAPAASAPTSPPASAATAPPAAKPTTAAKAPASATTAPASAAKPTTQAGAAVAPQAQAASAVDHSGQILLTPEQQYGVGSGLQVVANLYMKKYPNVKVQVDVKPQDGYSDWARAQITGGTKSSMMTASFLQDLLAANKFVDLTPYLQRQSPYVDKKWIDTFQAGTWRPDSPTNAIQEMNLMRTNVVWFYNQDLFKKAGLDPAKPPTTWTEFMNVADTLKKAGIQAFSIEGDYDGFWRMNIGWWRRLYLDSYIRDSVKYTRSIKGDFNYREDVDGKWQYDPKDPYNDDYTKMTNNPNRVVAAIQDKKFVVDGDVFRDAYGNHMRKMVDYGDPGYFGLSRELARQAFIAGKAAMWSDQPVFFPVYEKIVGAPNASIKRFNYSVFPYVTFDDSKLIEAPQRTFVGNLGFWVIPKKAQKQNDLEVDFFQFLTSPPVAKEFMVAGLTQPGGDLVGPMPVLGVEMPDVWKQRFDQMKDIGPAGPNASNYGGALLNEQQAARDYVDLTQRWFSKKIGDAEYYKSLQKSFDDTVPRLIKDQGLHPDKPEQQPTPRK